ncbi:hypothetical protein PBV88_35355, partial [Streptomyces sp. T21Q-yed]|nr:hypothetical protein [Streptomyces sp. T21Q-yed]
MRKLHKAALVVAAAGGLTAIGAGVSEAADYYPAGYNGAPAPAPEYPAPQYAPAPAPYYAPPQYAPAPAPQYAPPQYAPAPAPQYAAPAPQYQAPQQAIAEARSTGTAQASAPQP